MYSALLVLAAADFPTCRRQDVDFRVALLIHSSNHGGMGKRGHADLISNPACATDVLPRCQIPKDNSHPVDTSRSDGEHNRQMFPNISKATTTTHHLAIEFRGTHDSCMAARMSHPAEDGQGRRANELSLPPVALYLLSSQADPRRVPCVRYGGDRPVNSRRAVDWDSCHPRLMPFQQQSLLARLAVGVRRHRPLW